MLQPTGPLPSEIYWRRRMLAIGVVAVVLVILLGIVLVMRGGGGDSPQAAPAAATSAAAGSQPPGTSAPASSEASSATTAPATSGPASTTAAATTVPAAQPAPGAPGQCTDQSLGLKVSVEQPTYAVGTEPKFWVTVTNNSPAVCNRDVSGQQQVLVHSADGQQRLWASTDCYREPPSARNLKPGEQAVFTITWSAKTSQPSCAGTREAVKPGAYTVVAQLGALRSAPEPFNIA